MIAAHSTISAPSTPSHVTKILSELFAATPLFTFINALRGR